MIINLKFLFTLFPFVFTKNESEQQVIQKRSIREKGAILNLQTKALQVSNL